MKQDKKNSGNEFYEILSDEKDFMTIISTKGGNFTPMHYHGSVELVVCTKGEFSVRTCDGIINLHIGDACFFDSYETHGYFGAEDSETYILLYADSLFHAFRTRYGGVLPTRMHFMKIDCGDLITVIDRAYTNWKEYNYFMQLGFMNWVFGFAVRANGTVTRVAKAENAFVLKVLQFVNSHFAASLSVSKVAAEFGYSENYFSSLFNRCVGMRFGDYLNSVRLRKIDELINENPLIGIGKAAQLCGFVSPNTYYRAVKKMEDMKNLNRNSVK